MSYLEGENELTYNRVGREELYTRYSLEDVDIAISVCQVGLDMMDFHPTAITWLQQDMEVLRDIKHEKEQMSFYLLLNPMSKVVSDIVRGDTERINTTWWIVCKPFSSVEDAELWAYLNGYDMSLYEIPF